MTTIRVGLAERSYDIRVERGLLARAGEAIAPLAGGRRVLIVTDEHLRPQLETLTAGLAAVGLTADALVLAPGEGSKSWETLTRLCDWLLDRGVERSDHVVALGGGVIGDLAGFAAAIVKRGCGFVQVPTTLLAQVDSSVGGKTGINTSAGKNLVGAFHQPAMVLIDPDTLDTLPARELRAGYAEVLKYGLIDDPDFFAWCEAHGAAVIAGDKDAQTHAIATSVAAKARIVGEDERETSGRRALLNLGHTFGHALEAEAGYSGALVHGEAVAIGMTLAFGFSAQHRDLPVDDLERVRRHLKAVALPTSIAETGIKAPGARLVDHMRHDKKAAGGTLPFLLAHGIGQTYLDRNVDLGDVGRFLDAQPR